MKNPDPVIDVAKLLVADRRVLGQAITLIESSREDHRIEAEAVLDQIMPHTGKSLRIGITGVPGVGKSTFIDRLGIYVINRGHKVAVLAVDPTSTLSGGSILGDKTRMENLATNQNAFIRPSPSGAALGGVARRTRETILLCEAAGFDIVIVETVGVGQSETMVSEMTDLFLLMLLPGGGDDLQGIKRGIMELADIAIVNKADGDMEKAANSSVADIRHALELIKPRHQSWKVPVLPISALHREGIESIWQMITDFRLKVDVNNMILERRKQQSMDWILRDTSEILLQQLRQQDETVEILDDLQSQVHNGTLAPSIAARKLANSFIYNIEVSKKK